MALSAGAPHALVVDLGESGVRVALVLAGKVKSNHSLSCNKGGAALKSRIAELLLPSVLSEVVLDKALRLLLVSPTHEPLTGVEDSVLPGGSVLTSSIRTQVVEQLLFKVDGEESIHSLIAQLLEQCSSEERTLGLNNVVIGGGLSGISGLKERVRFEATRRAHHFATVLKCDATNGAFTGLTVLASMDIALSTPENYKKRDAIVGYAPGLFEE